MAVVLAGGESRRFGSDKLTADLAGRSLLEHAVGGLPAGASIVVVGPQRALHREVTFVREEPSGGGPAAGLITGLRWALDRHPEVIVTLPGDAPAGGRAAVLLADALEQTGAGSVMGIDANGRDQVLQLALRPPAALDVIQFAGPGAGQGQSVRRLVSALEPPPHRERLADDLVRDIDTADQLTAAQRHFRNPDRS